MAKNLVLLTNNYPYVGGDTPFVSSEIAALSEKFDHISVVTLLQRRSKTVPMPENVSLDGHILGSESVFGLLQKSGFRAARDAKRAFAADRGRGAGTLVTRVKASLLSALGSLAVARTLRERSWKKEETFVYAFWGMAAGLAVTALPEDLFAGYAVRVHRYDLYGDAQGFLPLRKELLGKARMILPVSEDGREHLLRTYPELVEDSRIRVSRLGTIDNGPAPIRHRADLSEPRVVVSCSSMLPVKAVDRIARVVSRASSAVPVHWVHFGDGKERTKVVAELQAIQSPGLTADLRGQTDHAELMAYYLTHPVDAFINLSESEGVPVSIMEAMSFGIPVVATNVGGTGEVVSSALSSGTLVDPEASDSEIAEALTEVLQERDKYKPRRAWSQLSDASRTAHELANLMAQLSENT